MLQLQLNQYFTSTLIVVLFIRAPIQLLLADKQSGEESSLPTVDKYMWIITIQRHQIINLSNLR
jgi:hypothetical protein